MNTERKRIIYCDKFTEAFDGYSIMWFHAMTRALEASYEVIPFPNLRSEIWEVVDHERRTNRLDAVISHYPWSEQCLYPQSRYRQSFRILSRMRSLWGDLPIVVYTGASVDDVHPAYCFADAIIEKSDDIERDAKSLVSALDSAWREMAKEREPKEPAMVVADGEVRLTVEVLLRAGLPAEVVIPFETYCKDHCTRVLIAREGDDCWFDFFYPSEVTRMMVRQHERVMLRVTGPEDAAIKTAQVLWRALSSQYFVL